MHNETPTKPSSGTMVEKGKPLPTDLSEQQDVKDAVAENERKRDKNPATDIEHPNLPPRALDENVAANTDDDVTAA